MKAAIINKYGTSETLEIHKDIPMPVLKDNQVIINIKAAGVNPLDCEIRKGTLRYIFGSKFPIILGYDAAGIIHECGKNVKDFKIGDKVFCMLDSNEKMSYFGFAKCGSYAEFAATREDTLSPMPVGLSYEESGSIPLCCLTVYQVLVNKIKLKKGDKILINGASGGVGVFAVQIAKALGAEVTAVCSTKNIAFVKRLGADHIVDYTISDFTNLHNKYDIIYDVIVGTSYNKCKKILNKGGVFISNRANLLVFLFPFLRKIRLFRNRTFAWVEPSGSDLHQITNMINNGQIKTVIDKIYTLEEIRKAHEYIEKGRVVGKLVIRIS